MNTTNNTSMNDTKTDIKSEFAAKGKELSSSISKSVKEVSKFNIGGISIPEVAILGAAGYVLWKNRAKIAGLLENYDIEVPALLNGDFSEVVQSGVSLLSSGKKDQSEGKSTQGQEKSSSMNKDQAQGQTKDFANKGSVKTPSTSQEFHS